MKKTDKKITKIAKNEKTDKKTYNEEDFLNVVSIAKTYEMLLARATAAIGVFLGDEMKKHGLLKEFMAVDRDARQLSFRFNKEVFFVIDQKSKATK